MIDLIGDRFNRLFELAYDKNVMVASMFRLGWVVQGGVRGEVYLSRRKSY